MTDRNAHGIEKAAEYIAAQDEPEEHREALTDALADLMHWAGREGADFDAALRMARVHFDEEGGAAS